MSYDAGTKVVTRVNRLTSDPDTASGSEIRTSDIDDTIDEPVTDFNAAVAALWVAMGDAATDADITSGIAAAIGVSTQAFDANLDSLSGLTFAANKGLYTTGANTAALYDLTAFGRSLGGSADGPAALTVLGVTAAGQALLDDASAAAQRTTLGLGTAATEAAADISPVGSHTIYLPASSFTATSTNGAEASSVELATNDIMVPGFDFDPTTNEKVQFILAMPKSWDEGTFTAQFAWKDAAVAGSGVVIWAVRMLALGDSDAMDVAFGTAQSITDTFQTSDDLHITAATGAITPGGTPAEGDFLVIEVYRDAADGGDTYDQDATFVGLKLIMTTNAPTDA